MQLGGVGTGSTLAWKCSPGVALGALSLRVRSLGKCAKWGGMFRQHVSQARNSLFGYFISELYELYEGLC